MTEPKSEIAGLVERAMALANAATYGPWIVWPRKHPQQDYCVGPDDPTLPVCRTFGNSYGAETNAAFIAASRQLIPELCEAITRLSQPSGEEIQEAAAKIADDQAALFDQLGSELTPSSVIIGGRITAQELMWEKAASLRAIAERIRCVSSGSNKSDEGKKGQTG